VGRKPLAGNRFARPALRRTRKDRGLSLESAASAVGISRVFLGNIERRDCRAATEHQERLSELYECTIDDLFEPQADVGYALPPAKGEWCLASEAERILDMTGEALRELVARGVLTRRGGESRYQFHRPTLLALVPEGTRKLSDLPALTGLTVHQLTHRRQTGALPAFRPWPGAPYRVLPENVARLIEQCAKRPTHSQAGLERLRTSQRAYIKTPAGRRRQKKHTERFTAQQKRIHDEYLRLKQELGLLDDDEIATMLDVTAATVRYYTRTGLIESETHTIEGRPFLLFKPEAVRKHRLEFARGLRPPGVRGPDDANLGVRGSHLNEEHVIKEARGKGLITPGSPEEEEVRKRVRRRRKTILPIATRITAAASSGGARKGHKGALEALEHAKTAIAKRPTLSKRGVYDYVAIQLYGADTVFLETGARRDAQDPVYQRCRKRVGRRLSRAFHDEGVPPELRHLFDGS